MDSLRDFAAVLMDTSATPDCLRGRDEARSLTDDERPPLSRISVASRVGGRGASTLFCSSLDMESRGGLVGARGVP